MRSMAKSQQYHQLAIAVVALLSFGIGCSAKDTVLPDSVLEQCLVQFTEDTDECEQDLDNCREHQLCQNTEGSYQCLDACDLGYSWNQQTQSCEDYDECQLGIDDCAPSWAASCENRNGSYVCRCNKGFEGDGHYCTQLDAEGCDTNCGVNEYCHHLRFSFYHSKQCLCKLGYVRQARGTYCKDRHECSTTLHGCHEKATCNELEPSYECKCLPGYEGNGRYCRDQNECVAKTHSCDLHAICTNTEGSYTCTCKSGFQGDGHVCTPCPDIDECRLENDCHPEAICTNTGNSYLCDCKIGFTGDGREQCNDIDECEIRADFCHPKAICINTVGSFYCECKNGYAGSGFQCREINCTAMMLEKPPAYDEADECLRENACPDNSVCENLPKSYHCVCYIGYRWDKETHACVDVDECQEQTDDCAPATFAYCLNTVGSYTCQCKGPRYIGDGHHCIRISDEGCTKQCYSGQFCAHFRSELHEAYDICMCPLTHYMVDLLKSECAVIKVCEYETTPCHEHAKCITLPSGYQCNCMPGYEGNGIYCQDSNECAFGMHTCHANARCINTAGGYECECRHGYTGDGRLNCDPIPCPSHGAARP